MHTFKGLTLDVYRSADGRDCTAGGISSRYSRFTLVGTVDGNGRQPVEPMPKNSRVFAARDDAPAVALQRRRIGEPTFSIVPVRWDDDRQRYETTGDWHMAGGNYASTSDSRLGELIASLDGPRFHGAISVHDRIER